MKHERKLPIKIRRSKLSMGMIWIILTCWLIPYVVVSGLLLYYMNGKSEEQLSQTIYTSIENVAEISKNKIEDAITLSLQASYDGVIRQSYEEFLADNDESRMYASTMKYLDRTYKYNKLIASTYLLYHGKTDRSYYTYSSVAGAAYLNVGTFLEKSAPKVKNIADSLETDTKLVNTDGHLFVVRNLVTADYRPFAILALEANKNYVFDSLSDVMWQRSSAVYVDDEQIYTSETMSDEQNQAVNDFYQSKFRESAVREAEGIKVIYNRDAAITGASFYLNGQKIVCMAKLDGMAISRETYIYMLIFLVVFVMLIPLLIATFLYFYRNINKPINSLVNASQHIENGEYGYEVEPLKKDNEFKHLEKTFNHMSVSLRESFNRIYAEEVAVRDAEMKALQSQINPHFLNNTLEIINWKARMSGNEDVSEMISALNVMLTATMNRKNEAFISIREELEYVDAYLYIIFARFGEKFQFEKQIDETVLDFQVPRLIIQPLVENAVEHGGDEKGKIEGKLVIAGEEDCIRIQVVNNGDMTSENKERIRRLLSDDNVEDLHKNIGIRNVNLRLKMIYGEQSGLKITTEQNHTTVSEIVIQRKSGREK